MEVQIKTSLPVSVSALVEAMSLEETAELLSEIARVFDDKFPERAKLAARFADGISELGARFLADIVAHHVSRRGGV